MRGFKEDTKGASATTGALAVLIVLAIAYGGYQIYTEREASQSLKITGASPAELPEVSEGSVKIPLEIEITNNSQYNSPPATIDYEIFIENTRVETGTLNIKEIEPNGTNIENITFEAGEEDFEFLDDLVITPLTDENFVITAEGTITAELFMGTLPYKQPFNVKYEF